MLENPTRSDFFICRMNVGFMYVEQLMESQGLHGSQPRCNKHSILACRSHLF
ncbi:conserved hypothetical protein [Priestia megaterium]